MIELSKVKVLTKVVTTLTLASTLAWFIEGVESYAMIRKATRIVKQVQQVQKGTILLSSTRPYHMKREGDNNRDALLRAVKEKNITAATQILESDPTMDINEFTDHRGFSPFWISLTNEDVPMVSKLAHVGADVCENSPELMRKITPLDYAIKKDNVPLVSILLKNGALKDEGEKSKASKLYNAIINHCDIKVIQLLVDAIGSKDIYSDALQTAIYGMYPEAVKTLVEAGADMEKHVYSHPYSALEYAFYTYKRNLLDGKDDHRAYQRIVEYLQSAGAKPLTFEEEEAIQEEAQKKDREYKEYIKTNRLTIFDFSHHGDTWS